MSDPEEIILIKQGTSIEDIEQIYRKIDTTSRMMKINLCYTYSKYGVVEIGSKNGDICKHPNISIEENTPTEVAVAIENALKTHDVTELDKIGERILKALDEQEEYDLVYDRMANALINCEKNIGSSQNSCCETQSEEVD